jgi:hypothetical protein
MKLRATHNTHMNSIDDLFEALGGPTKVGQIIGKRVEHAGSMKSRGSIPVRYWPSLIVSERGKELGLSWEWLARLHGIPVDFVAPSGEPSTQAAE